MSRLLTVNEICERALRKIGEFSINDSAALGPQMEEARWWLDMVVGHIAATQRRWWLVPATASFPLLPGQADYSTTGNLGELRGVMHIISLWRVSESDPSDREEVRLLRRREWEEREGAGTLGIPTAAYVDRADIPTIHLHPTPATTQTYRLEVVYHRFAPDLTPRAGRPHVPMEGLRQSWNLAIVHALAAEIGNGPVRKMPGDEVRDMQETARRYLHDLDSYDAHEQANEPRRVAYNDF